MNIGAKESGRKGEDSADESKDNTLTMAEENEIATGHELSGSMAQMMSMLQAMQASMDEIKNNNKANQIEMQALRAIVTSCENDNESVSSELPEDSNEEQPVPNANHSVPAVQPMVKIYDLPKFSGNAEDWPLFKSNFDETTQAFQYTNTHNLMRLQKSLVGLARETVQSILIFPNDVPNVMEELQFRFGRPELLVKVQLQQIQQIKPIPEGKLDQIVVFSTKVRNVVAFLKSANCNHHLSNPTLLEHLIVILPVSKQLEWARQAATILPYPTIADFSTWLSELSRFVSLMPNTFRAAAPDPPSQPTRRIMHLQETEVHREVQCSECAKTHFIVNCQIFKALSVADRWNCVKKYHLCFCCLTKGHNTFNCRVKKPCNVNNCRRNHHHMLHEERAEPPASNKPQTLLNCRTPCSSQLFKIMPVILYGPNGRMELYAMLDEGSSLSLLEESVAKQLGLKGNPMPLQLQWYGEQIHNEVSTRVSLEVSAKDGNCKYNLKNVCTIKNLNLPSQTFVKTQFPYLQLLPVEDYVNVKPKLLIGLDHAHLGATATIVQADVASPIASKTKLGWTVYGPAANTSSATSPVVLHIREHDELDKLNKLVGDYFAADACPDVPIQKIESEEDIRARHILNTTTKQIGKRFEIGLLWKQENISMPSSYEMAEKRLHGIERKMDSDSTFAQKYREEMQKYLDKDYARVLEDDEIIASPGPVWYIPHFAVQTPHKPGKMRIVFDAAASVSDISLNSKLLKGPEQMKPLLDILFKFREGPIAVAADIREMFSQIKIRTEDQQAQRFLWRSNKNEPIQHFVMTSMIFGAVSSPCSADFIKNINAERYNNQYPQAVDAIIRRHYVDDFVCSFKDDEEAIIASNDVLNIHANAGFELRGFVSNSAKVQNALNKDIIRADPKINMEKQSNVEKILGMFWDTTTDTFQFKTQFHRVPQLVLQGTRLPTKRELLGIVMAVFEPLGLLADFLIFSKILVQETWKCQIGWDDPIPSELHHKWYF